MTDPRYPLLAARFEVDFGGGRQSVAIFSEVSGLDGQADVVEYRGGDREPTLRKLPHVYKHSNVTMKRGVCGRDNDLLDWWNKVRQGQLERRTVTVKLRDEAGKVVVAWTLNAAWPVKLDSISARAKGSEVAVESIEFCHEGLSIVNGA